MELTRVYSIIIGAVFVLLVLYRTILNLFRALQLHTLHFVLKHLVYAVVLRRRRFLGPWTRWYLILQFLYWGITLSCVSIGVKTLAQAGARAGTLGVILLVPLFFGGHLSFAADLLGMPLLAYRQVHGSIGTSVFVLSLFHALVNVITGPGLSFQNNLQLYGLIVRRTHR
jgi:hypothetical protein